MAPYTLSAPKNGHIPIKKFEKSTEKTLSDEQLQMLIKNYVWHETSQKENENIGTTEEELYDWFDSQSVLSFNGNYEHESEERKNDIFMYNFFLRRHCPARSAEYLEKIESMKGEKMRQLISKIRKLSVNYISLPVERISPEDAMRRERIRRLAIDETRANRMNGLRIMKSIMPTFAQRT
uniref:Uncharacterized protein n=1 Tax=Caenorhabditis japonica TaxID=281687 RepID=A0A8R1I8U3_CAEJA